MVDPVVWDIGYLVSAALFIIGIKRLSSPRTAPQGNMLGAYGMLLAVLVTLVKMYTEEIIGFELIIDLMNYYHQNRRLCDWLCNGNSC